VTRLAAEPVRRATRWPIYYGWVNVLFAAMAMTATLPGRTHGLGIITTPLLGDLRIDAALYSQFNFWTVLLGSLLGWLAGQAIDRFGVRLVGFLVIVGLGGAVLEMSRVHEPWPLFWCLLFVRGLGQGALSIVSMAMVSKWFARRLGPAMGVYSVLLGIGFIINTLTLIDAVAGHGWRTAWGGLGWILLAGLAPLVLLFTRNAPASSEFPEVERDCDVGEERRDATLLEALASPAFWVFSLAACIYGLAWSAITLYNQAILEEHGFGQHEFRTVMGLLVACGLVANLLGGWLATRWPLGRLMGIGMLTFAASLAIFPLLKSTSGLYIYGVLLGVAGGWITVVYFAFYGRAFGRRNVGTIQGTAHLLSVFASAAGPVLLTWCHRQSSGHDVFFLAVAPVAALCGVASWCVPTPKQRDAAPTTEANELGKSASIRLAKP
jgi:MFS family permease